MRKSILALGTCLIATVSKADVVNYDCQLHSLEAQGWIPPRILLSIDADGKRARAYDAAIRQNNALTGQNEQKPMDAKFKVNRRAEYQMNWRVTLQAATSGQMRLSYMAILNPKTNEFELVARFPMSNVTNRPSGVGNCKVVKSPSLF